MTCDDALRTMLEAELDELALHAPSPLRAHLGTCARCAAVATRLRADTAALGQVLLRAAAPPAAHRRRQDVQLPVLAVAGALALAVALRTPAPSSDSTHPATTAERAPAAAAEAAARTADAASPAAPVVGVSTGGTARAPEERRPERAIEPARDGSPVEPPPSVLTNAFVATPVAPVRLDSAGRVVVEAVLDRAVEVPNLAASARTPEITVRPPAGTRALVARTGDPRISVVWFY